MCIELPLVDRPGAVALVDDEHADLARYRWRYGRQGVYRHADRIVRLPHVIVGDPVPGHFIVHVDANRLNCTAANLVVMPRAAWLAVMRDRCKQQAAIQLPIVAGELF